MDDRIKMVTNPQDHEMDMHNRVQTLCLTIDEFLHDPLHIRHDQVLQESFKKIGSYGAALFYAQFIVIAVDSARNYLGSTLVCRIDNTHSLEYVQTDPNHRREGISQVVIDRAKHEMKRLGVEHLELKCKEELRRVYAKSGFREPSK